MDIKPPKKRRINRTAALPDMKNFAKRSFNSKVGINDKLQPRAAGPLHMLKPVLQGPAIKDSINKSSDNLKQRIMNDKLLTIYGLLAFSVAFSLYLYRLPHLPKPTLLDGVNALQVQSFTDLSFNIVFGPQKFLDYLLLKLNLASPLGLRLSSVFFSVIALVAFFFIIKRWLSVKIAVLATLIFSVSTWTIMQTRNADFMNSFFLVIPVLLLAGSYLKREKESIWLLPIIFLISITTYLPGVIWFLLFSATVYFNNLREFIQTNTVKKNIAYGLTYILPLIPLIYFLFKNTSSFKLWLGLPAEFKFELSTLLDNLIALPSKLFVSGVESPLLWLYGSPLIDVATAVLALSGFMFVIRDRAHPVRRISLAGLLIMSLFGLFIAGDSYISLFLPLFYIFTAFGIHYLLEQWFSIFPRNPVARSMGYVLMCLLVASISFYHVSRYFIVWPRNDRVIGAFESVSSDTINNSPNNKFYFYEE